MLGIPYDYGVDMWSIGCTLFELYTGKILFAGDSNNQMLKAIMEVRGRFTPKLYRRGELWPQHFNEAGEFVSYERDKVLGKVCELSFCASVNPMFQAQLCFPFRWAARVLASARFASRKAPS